MVRMLGIALFLMLVPCGCDGGDDDDDDDTADAMITAIDGAAADGANADAGPTACQVLCNCTESTCGQELTACLAECEGLAASARACRTEHCGFAQTDATFHCPHARGESLCD
jgi:hypothetical protein